MISIVAPSIGGLIYLVEGSSTKTAEIEAYLADSLTRCSNCLYDLAITVESTKPEYLQSLKTAGLQLQTSFDNKVYGTGDASVVSKIRNLPFAVYISGQQKLQEMAIITQGLATLRADIAQNGGLDGSGAKVAVIDSGFDVNNLEIKDNVKEFRNFRTDGRNDFQHGTAVSEIIVDIAPQVELYLYVVSTDGQMIQAIDRAITQKVNIFSTSLGLLGVIPRDGSSALSRKLEQAHSAGVTPIVAAGNDARRHWSGKFSDSNKDGWTSFNATLERNFLRYGTRPFCAYLSWNDWPFSSQDYDLYLFDGDDVVASSTTRQSGRQVPGEELCFTPRPGRPYSIGIKNYSATREVNFDLFLNSAEPVIAVAEGSIAVPADSRAAVTVGAMHWNASRRPASIIESYSSRGPTLDGRVKPDVVAPTCVATTSYNTPFCGTSSSAPHVAGIAALLVGGNPSLTPNDIQTLLEKGSVDFGVVGKDNIFGAGVARVSVVSLDTDPRPASLSINGQNITISSEKVFVWKPNVLHTVSANPIHMSDEARLGFKQWSTGSTERTLQINYDGSFLSLVATYDAEYRVRVLSNYGQVQGDGWYQKGSQVPLSVNPSFEHGNSTRRVFLGWTGDAQSSSARITLTVDSPKKVDVKWQKQYEFVAENQFNSSFSRAWFDENSGILLRTQERVEHENFTRHLFNGWSGDVSSASSTILVRLDAPKKVSAEWRTQYKLRVAGGSSIVLLGSNSDGWYDRGATATISTERVWDVSQESRESLAAYSIDGSRTDVARGESQLTLPPIQMTKSVNIELIPVEQFRILATSSFGSAKGAGWYDRGSIAEISVEQLVDHENKTRRIFESWQEVDSTSNTIRVRVDSPRAFNALWRTQYEQVFSFRDREGRIIAPEIVQIVNERGIQNITTAKGWVDAGDFSINAVYWKGFNIAEESPQALQSSSPKEFVISARIYDLKIWVRDAIGIPIPFAVVKMQLSNGTLFTGQTAVDGQLRIMQVPLEEHEITAESLGFAATKTVNLKEGSTNEIRMGLSIPVITAAIILIAVALLVRKERNRLKVLKV